MTETLKEYFTSDQFIESGRRVFCMGVGVWLFFGTIEQHGIYTAIFLGGLAWYALFMATAD